MNKFIIIVSLLFVSCGYYHPCDNFCRHISNMQCDGWQGSPGEDGLFGTEDDYSCSYICKLAEPSVEVDLNLECVIEAKTCEEYESCY